MKNGNQFITVQGAAGGSYDPSLGDEGHQASDSETDKVDKVNSSVRDFIQTLCFELL